ncbi:hypothetical protein [Sphingomonas changnyeongensis]|nr:hypothetical protein [Sphingomonas changnyeongensis]
MSTLLVDIEAFLTAHDMSPTRFGEQARGDRHLVRQLREEKRRVWPETEQAIRRFMATYPNHEPWVPKRPRARRKAAV